MIFNRIERAFDLLVDLDPGRKVVSSARGAWSYGRLRGAAKGLARLLTARVELDGGPVGIVLPNGAGFLQAVLATWYARGTAVPISPFYPVARVKQIVSLLGLRTLVAPTSTASELAGFVDCLVALDPAGKANLVRNSRTPPTQTLSHQDHAVMFLTSGTTGRPKIAALTHTNILSNLAGQAAAMPIGERDRSFVCVPMCHSYGFTVQAMASILGGRRLYIGADHKFGVSLAREVAASRCTSLVGVPAIFRLLIDGVGRCGLTGMMPHLRTLINGAASMTVDLLAAVRRSFPEAQIYLTYGLSEASPLVTVLPPALLDRYGGSIGRAIPNVELCLLGPDGTMTRDAGETGEILIKGPSVITEYHGNPDATRAGFHKGYLRTGDLATMSGDGCLQFKGRSKDVINRGGENIYPEDIEAVLMRHAAVAEAAVVGRSHRLYGQVPYAFVVPEENSHCCRDALRAWCSSRLSAQQMPAGFQIVQNLPRTLTHKVRKVELVDTLSRQDDGKASSIGRGSGLG